MNKALTDPTADATTCDQCAAPIQAWEYIYVTNTHKHPRHRKVICYDCMAKRGKAYKVTYHEKIAAPPMNHSL